MNGCRFFKRIKNRGGRSFGDLWRHGFHDVVSILGTEKHQVTSDSQLIWEGKATACRCDTCKVLLYIGIRFALVIVYTLSMCPPCKYR